MISIFGRCILAQEDPSTFSCTENSHVKIMWPIKTTETPDKYYIMSIEPYTCYTFFCIVFALFILNYTERFFMESVDKQKVFAK